MSVRQSLLAILDQGPCYGYQLRAEHARRTGATAPLNVGQIYTTLERLERDGLVGKHGSDERGHVYWGITDAGRREVRGWFSSPVPPPARDDLAGKIALAATLPGVDAAAVVRAERDAVLARIAAAAEAGPGDLASSIVRSAEQARMKAELEWLDAAAAAIAADGGRGALPLSADRPRRGRPARTAGQAS